MLHPMTSRPPTRLVVALLVVVACAKGGDAPVKDVDAVAALAGKPTLAGGTIEAGALADKVVVINFWSPG